MAQENAELAAEEKKRWETPVLRVADEDNPGAAKQFFNAETLLFNSFGQVS